MRQRFDVTENLEKFSILGGKLNSARLKPRVSGSTAVPAVVWRCHPLWTCQSYKIDPLESGADSGVEATHGDLGPGEDKGLCACMAACL